MRPLSQIMAEIITPPVTTEPKKVNKGGKKRKFRLGAPRRIMRACLGKHQLSESALISGTCMVKMLLNDLIRDIMRDKPTGTTIKRQHIKRVIQKQSDYRRMFDGALAPDV